MPIAIVYRMFRFWRITAFVLVTIFIVFLGMEAAAAFRPWGVAAWDWAVLRMPWLPEAWQFLREYGTAIWGALFLALMFIEWLRQRTDGEK